jgi:RNA polymerase sigma-70 factor (ECF subfamily)
MTEGELDFRAKRFEENRGRLRTVAYRMLGSRSEADDAVQEAWLRLSRSGVEGVENLGGWLTTVVARLCLDILRSRKSRREAPLPVHLPEAAGAPADPEQETLLAEAVGPALLIVLDTLSPAERLAFVLHDMFAVPFEEIAPIVGRSETAARQLASRGRRKVQGASAAQHADRARQREVVEAFLAASRAGEFDRLLAMLDPEVVLRADAAAVALGSPKEVLGARNVASTFSGRARAARLALVNGSAGLVWMHAGQPRVVFTFAMTRGKIVGIEILADPDRLRQLKVVVSPSEGESS